MIVPPIKARVRWDNKCKIPQMVWMLITDTGDDGHGVVKKDVRGLKSSALVWVLGHQLVRATGIVHARERGVLLLFDPLDLWTWKEKLCYKCSRKRDLLGFSHDGWHMQAECRDSHTSRASVWQLTSFNIPCSKLRDLYLPFCSSVTLLPHPLTRFIQKPCKKGWRRQHCLHVIPGSKGMSRIHWLRTLSTLDERSDLSFHS